MKELTKIKSKKNFKFGPSWESVYNWENAISESFDLPIVADTKFKYTFRRLLEKLKLQNSYNLFCNKNKLQLLFVMTAASENLCELSGNTVPVIIDFWFKDDEINDFIEAYERVPFILISSMEVYEKLLKLNINKNIYHWPLSLSDKSILNLDLLPEKKYDLVTVGRVNPYFSRMLDKYCEKYPDFEYVIGKGSISDRYFETNKGLYIGDGKDMKSYYNIINSSKIAFYSTPGCDEAKEGANGYNQVTPRFLELISGGCFIIAHYTENPDTKFYEINEFCNDTSTYEDFERQMNFYRNPVNKPEINKYRSYLKKHITSQRVKQLSVILKKEKIKFIEQ